MGRTITPVDTRRLRIAPDAGERPPTLAEQVATLAETQETVLTTTGNAPARQDALAKVRALLGHMRGGRNAE